MFDDWRESGTFPNTKLRLAVYLPSNKNFSDPMNLLVCNDGEAYRYDKGAAGAPAVLESLQRTDE